MFARLVLFILATFIVVTVGWWLYMHHRPGTHIHVKAVAKRQKFVVPYTSRLGAIDPSALVRVRGYLDEKAAIYQDRGATLDSNGLPVWPYQELYRPNHDLLRIKPGKIDTTIIFGTGSTNFSLIYQPLTAKRGELMIDVDY